MADEKDKNKQNLSYRPEIEYQDTYESEHSYRDYLSVNVNRGKEEDESRDIIEDITNVFNEVSKVIPLLPASLQTSINNVYKPILDTWASIYKDPETKYPIVVPDPEKITFVVPDGDPGTTPPSMKEIFPIPPEYPDPTPPGGNKPGPNLIDDGIWTIDPPVIVQYPEPDPIEIIEKEYIKNIADLFDYYVNRLKDIIYHYCSEKLTAIHSKKIDEDGNFTNKTATEKLFVVAKNVFGNNNEVREDCKHLFDAGVAMSEKARLKLNFMNNAFPLEQTLLHLKTFKTVQLLRLRYAKIDLIDGSNKIDAMSNNVLKAMRTSYDQKYDVSFSNLYKHLNGSLDILEDVLQTELAGIKARKTLIEKGGIKR